MGNRGRPPRLDPEAYTGQRTVSFTAVVLNRTPIFTDADIVEAMIAHLKRACDEHLCTCLIYCFMPDHGHFILRGLEAESNCCLAMSRFKYLSGNWLSIRRLPKWQEGFHDRVMRWQELRDHAKYVAMNPVRAGMVENFNDYPYLGSFLGSVPEVLASIADSEEF